MSSLPYSILLNENEEILPMLSIQEHQKFCKSLLKFYQSFKKKNSDEKINKNKLKLEDEYFQTHKKQNQEEILKWFENLTEYEKIKICTIKNKWLVNILIQLYIIYNTYDSCYIIPNFQMEDLFQPQKNFSHEEEDLLNNIMSKNYYQNYSKKKILVNNLNFYENYFKIDKNNNNNIFSKTECEKRIKEKKFIDSIKLLSLEDNNIIDTLTVSKDILGNNKELKEFLLFFSKNECFQDWLLPIKLNNIYNFVFPTWMHNNKSLNLFQLIIGYIEQQILLNYEFFYYSRKLYDFSYNNKIIYLYEENKKLVSFVKENYSFHDNNDDINKKEFISLMEIREIVKDIKKSRNYDEKIIELQKLYNYAYNNEFNPGNKRCILNMDFDKLIYEELYKESMNEGECECGIAKVIDHITFMKFQDIINARDNLFTALRKKIADNQYQKIMDELTSGNLNSGNSNKKKNKNKKKKKKSKNSGNKTKSEENQESNNAIKNLDVEEQKDSEKNTNNIDQIKEININEDNINNENKKIKEKEINFDNNKNENNTNNELKIQEKSFNIENNKNAKLKEITINRNFHEKEEENEEILNLEKKKKNKDFFLYPINNKKKNKNKKKLQCLSAKKNIENKEILIEDKKETKNKSPSFESNKEKNLNILKIINVNLKIESKDQENNFRHDKSPSYLEAQHQSFSFLKKDDDSNNDINNTKEININTKIKNNMTFEDQKINKNENNNINNNVKETNNTINNTKYKNNLQIKYSNIPIIPSNYTPYAPSEKFFDSLSKEISNYMSITNKNISILNDIHLKYLTDLENLIKNELGSKYEIKFGHYGSHFTDLSIEGSDLDILINYKSKISDNSDFNKDIISILNQNYNKFDSINPILTASVPVIKLQIDIKSEINNFNLNHMPYFEDENELQKIKVDLTFTQNEQEFLHSHQTVKFINQSLISFPMVKPLLLILKRYFKIMKMNKSFHGGLSSYSLYLLIYSFFKKFPSINSSSGKALYSFLAFFSFFEFYKYGIDIGHSNIYYLQNDNILNNWNFDEEIKKKEINIIDPLTKLNVAKSSFKIEEIQNTFRNAYNFLRTEGCYYDYAILANKTGYENNYFSIKTNFELDNCNDFKTIKKLFTLNKNSFLFDFFSN